MFPIIKNLSFVRKSKTNIIQQQNTNKYNENKIVQSKISECILNLLIPKNKEIEELLIKNLWNSWYKTTYGYVDEYKEQFGDKINNITIGQAIKANSFHANLDYSINTKYKAKSIGGIKKMGKIYRSGGAGSGYHSHGKNRNPLQIQQVPVKYFDYFK